MHRDSSDRFQVQTVPSLLGRKRLGSYLIEAGLITEAQVSVALNDQQATGMKFGEVLATRGWVKQQTVEYLMQKVILPERKASNQGRESGTHSKSGAKAQPTKTPPSQARRPDVPVRPASSTQRKSKPSEDTLIPRKEVPISKPLPSVAPPDEDVSWVG